MLEQQASNLLLDYSKNSEKQSRLNTGNKEWKMLVLSDGRLATYGSDGQLKIWDLDSGQSQLTFTLDGRSIDALAELPNGNIIAVMSKSDDSVGIFLFDLKSQKVTQFSSIESISRYTTIQAMIKVLSNDRILYAMQITRRQSGYSDSVSAKMGILDINSTKKICDGYEASIAITVLSNELFVGSTKEKINIFDINGKLVQELSKSTGAQAFALLKNGYLASSTNDVIKIWDIKNGGRRIKELKGHTGHITSLLALPNGYLASGALDEIKIWDIDKAICVSTLSGYERQINELALLPDGRVVSLEEGVIRIWEFPALTNSHLLDHNSTTKPSINTTASLTVSPSHLLSRNANLSLFNNEPSLPTDLTAEATTHLLWLLTHKELFKTPSLKTMLDELVKISSITPDNSDPKISSSLKM